MKKEKQKINWKIQTVHDLKLQRNISLIRACFLIYDLEKYESGFNACQRQNKQYSYKEKLEN